jgi:cyclopropane-fatty-acyl-phospholipid synthase
LVQGIGCVSVRLFHPTARLCRELLRVLPERPFSIEFWDGGRVPATQPQAPTFFVRRASAIAHALRAPGPLGLGRAYVEGSLETDDIDGAFVVVDDWVPPPIAPRDKARLLGALALAALPAGIPRRPSTELLLPGVRHSPERDAQAIRYHYDVGNDFFALFLDESMTYSCALFSRGAETLAEAQHAKLDLIAKKLELKAGQRVLDVGCGWGSFAIHAAREYGVSVTGITLSPSQAELAIRLVAEAGVADSVEIRVADYRELAGEPYDAIASIGMAEHVGESQIDTYARSLFRVLKPGGLVLNHAISLMRPEEDPLADKFTMRYVFPDAEPLLLSRVQLAFERARFYTEHIEGFMTDYAVTLRHWHDRLDEHAVEAERLAGAERLRIWRLYLRAGRHGFDVGYSAVYQLKARRPAGPGIT